MQQPKRTDREETPDLECFSRDESFRATEESLRAMDEFFRAMEDEPRIETMSHWEALHYAPTTSLETTTASNETEWTENTE